MLQQRVRNYVIELQRSISEALATTADGGVMDLAAAIGQAGQMARQTTRNGGTIFFIGNGGSAGIASHMAIDFTKNGGMRALAFNDGSYLTCLGNDLGFDRVFSKPLEMHARSGDLVFAISSSGRSANILNAADAAIERGCQLLTLSGFDENNALRRKGDLNFYVSSSEYGFVEISHLALIHMILDLVMGWGEGQVQSKARQPVAVK
ncbi:MAG: SIS domain-containing protein [Alphaproteobacteria bacterium]